MKKKKRSIESYREKIDREIPDTPINAETNSSDIIYNYPYETETPETEVQKKYDRLLMEALSQLEPRHRNIIEGFYGIYGEKKTLKQLSQDDPKKVTPERIRQIKDKSLGRIRYYIRNHWKD